MTRGDFDETAARARLERAREEYAAARVAAVAAYDRRADALDEVRAAEEAYAIARAFDGRPPRVGDKVVAGLAPGYPEGVVVGVRVTRSARRREAASVHVTVSTDVGEYVARRPVPLEVRAEQRKAATL